MSSLQIAQEKQLSKLTDHAFTINTVEDFVRLVGQQVSSMQKRIGEIILCCQSAYLGPRQYCLKQKRLFERTPKNIWPTYRHSQINQKSDSIYLANELGRPIHKVFSLPLLSPYKKEYHLPILFIEYFSKDETIQNIFIPERREILKSAFAKVLSEEHWYSGCKLWQCTFDNLQEPLAVLNQDKEVVRCNAHFKNTQSMRPVEHNQNTFRKEGQLYEKQTYRIQNEQSNYTIEHFVNVTSEHLLREKIAQNKRMSILGRLADDIAHQLNNPLTGIRSMAQILHKETKENTQQKEIFLELEKASSRCQNIIKNFIQFSKQSEIHTQCELNQVIAQTIPFLKTMIQTKKINLDLSKEDLWIQANPSPLQQVLFNLIKNALEAILPTGHVIIQSRLNQNQVILNIKDNGCGISEENRKLLFEPFFTTKKKGNGLGLRISHQWIQKFGGRLYCTSQLNKGSCFTFELPYYKRKVV